MGKVLAAGGAVVMMPVALIALAIVAVMGVGGFEPPRCGGEVSSSGLMGTSIMGPPSLTAAQIAAWYRSGGRPDTIPTIGTSVEDLATLYVFYGAAEGVRPEVAFVQAIVETGGFTNLDARTLNNFAGIGHCDTCGSGMAFPSVAAGVNAQVQLLRRVVEGNNTPLAGPVVAPTWGGRQASDLAGLARNWASSPIYGEVLASTLGSLVASAGTPLPAGTTTGGECGGSSGFPVPRDAIGDESWLTKPHHDYPAADIPVAANTDVFAPVSGTVTAAPVGGLCGLGVSIRDDAGNSWTLCHGADGGELVKPGDQVQRRVQPVIDAHFAPCRFSGAHSDRHTRFVSSTTSFNGGVSQSGAVQPLNRQRRGASMGDLPVVRADGCRRRGGVRCDQRPQGWRRR